MKLNKKIAVIKSDLKNCIRWYLKLTVPLHKLRTKEIDVLTEIIYLYHLSKEKDEIDKWADVFSYDNRIKMRENLGDMQEMTFNNHLSMLRNKKAIVNNRVPKNFNPLIEDDSNGFEMVLRFLIK